MRVISMVPSWTETLLVAGVEVVGRTRYCIHPESSASAVPAVGGTKDVDWAKVRELRPDLLVLDREENPLQMAELARSQGYGEVFATHVQAIEDVAIELDRIAKRLGRHSEVELEQLAARWRRVEAASPLKLENWAQLPGVLQWIRTATEFSPKAVYLIWREPWMAASQATFIGSVLKKVGVAEIWSPGESKYPSFAFDEIPEDAVLLCSSEPFPFAKPKFRDELKASGRACVVVDGESFSWFGLRSLTFLEHALKLR